MPSYTLSTDDIFVTTLVEKWMTSKDEVAQIDEDMALDSLGKTKLLNGAFVEANPVMEEKDGKLLNITKPKDKPSNELAVTIRTYFENHGIEDEAFVGLFETVRRLLGEFDDRVEKYVKANIVEVPESEKPTEAELTTLREKRKKAVDNMNGILTLLEGTAPEWYESEGKFLLEKIDNLRGAVGNREKMGERLGSTFTYTVVEGDNEHVLSSKNLSGLKEYLKAESVAAIRKLIESNNPGFVWKTPPDKFTFEYNGKFVTAIKNVDDSPEEEEDSTEPELDLVVDTESPTEGSVTTLFDDDE